MILNECRAFADIDALQWLNSSNCQGHRWRYARANKIASDINHQRIVMAGDDWGEPVGTVGGAVSSGAWAAADLLYRLNNLSKKGVEIQSSLLDNW